MCCPSGNTFALTFIERVSGLALTYYSKTTADVGRMTQQFLKDVEPHMKAAGVKDVNVALGKTIMHSDNASYYVGKDCKFSKELKARGITHVVGPPYTPQAQGKVERYQQTIARRAASLREAAGLDGTFWEQSWKYCTRTYNLLDNGNTIYTKSPIEVATGDPRIREALDLKPFGQTCFVMTPITTQKEAIRKKAYKAIYLGPGDSTGSHKILDTRGNLRKLKTSTGTLCHIRRIH